VTFLYIAPDDDVDPVVIAAVGTTLAEAFRLPTKAMSPSSAPVYAYDPTRGQFGSSSILRRLLEQLPPDALRVLAITERDLFIPMLTFVFGQAQLNGPVALVSLARLRQEHYHLPPDLSLLLARGRKESVHELGHSFGLTHCATPGCVMSLCATIQQVDRKSTLFCAECRPVLDASMGRLPTTLQRGGAP
jgi:archaemetzincin